MKLNNIKYTDEDINNLDDYFSKEIEEYKKIEKSLNKEIDKLTAESTEWESKYYDMLDNFHNANKKINKQKEVLDKIKEYAERNEIEKPRNDFENGINIVATKVLELLEEIE